MSKILIKKGGEPMTREQRKFITDLIGSVKKHLLSKEIPKEWDGLELRWFIADHFRQMVLEKVGSIKRRRDYLNTMRVNNLY